MNFSDTYQLRYGVQPTYHAAFAAAMGLPWEDSSLSFFLSLSLSQDRFATPNPQVCRFYFLNLGQKEKSLLRKPDSP